MDPDLARRLTEAGVDPDNIEDPADAWDRLLEISGEAATLFDRYGIEAAHRRFAVTELTQAVRQQLGAEFFAVRFPGLELIGDPSGLSVEVSAYDDRWPDVFAAWRHRLSAALGKTALSIEHVGSTAVPELAAKPIVDVQVTVADLEDETTYVSAIESTGVPLRSRHDEDRYFRPPADVPRVVQIHVCASGGDWERNHLLFRDYLRADAGTRDSYAALKFELADRYRDDRVAYTEGKTEFIRDALSRAEAWADTTGWAVPAGSAEENDQHRHSAE